MAHTLSARIGMRARPWLFGTLSLCVVTTGVGCGMCNRTTMRPVYTSPAPIPVSPCPTPSTLVVPTAAVGTVTHL